MKQKDIKKMIADGLATDITDYDFDAIKNFMETHSIETVDLSAGIYGMNGGLFKDRETGELYAIKARSGALFQIV